MKNILVLILDLSFLVQTYFTPSIHLLDGLIKSLLEVGHVGYKIFSDTPTKKFVKNQVSLITPS